MYLKPNSDMQLNPTFTIPLVNQPKSQRATNLTKLLLMYTSAKIRSNLFGGEREGERVENVQKFDETLDKKYNHNFLKFSVLKFRNIRNII